MATKRRQIKSRSKQKQKAKSVPKRRAANGRASTKTKRKHTRVRSTKTTRKRGPPSTPQIVSKAKKIRRSHNVPVDDAQIATASGPQKDWGLYFSLEELTAVESCLGRGPATSEELSIACGWSPTIASGELRDMEKRGYIERVAEEQGLSQAGWKLGTLLKWKIEYETSLLKSNDGLPPNFIRGDKWCSCGKSMNWGTKELEEGLSAWTARKVDGGWQPLERKFWRSGITATKAPDYPWYLVQGDTLEGKLGSDGEPLLKSMKVKSPLDWKEEKSMFVVGQAEPVEAEPIHDECKEGTNQTE